MKAVKINLAGRERHLCFTVEAMFQIEERFGGAQELTDTMEANSRTGFEAVCGAAAILAEQGELCRLCAVRKISPSPWSPQIWPG